MSMTIKELNAIINNLPEDTVIFVEETLVNDVKKINVEYFSDGRVHLIFSTLE